MEVINERCCGLDVHKKTVVPCLITPQGQETRTFRTMTQGLLELADWLEERQVIHMVMESTGAFWKPIVRHEALFYREGMREPLLGSVAAGH
jgi:hypothetical protein